MQNALRVTVKWQRTKKKKMFPSVDRLGALIQLLDNIEVGRPPRPCLQEILRSRSEEPGGRERGREICHLAVSPGVHKPRRRDTSRRLSSAPLSPVDSILQQAAAALTERLSVKYDKDFCFSPQPRAIERR